MVDLNFQLLSAYIAHIFPCLDHQSQDALAPEASQDIFLALSRLALSITWPSRCIKIGQPVMSLTFSRDNQLLIVPSAFCISNKRVNKHHCNWSQDCEGYQKTHNNQQPDWWRFITPLTCSIQKIVSWNTVELFRDSMWVLSLQNRWCGEVLMNAS